MELAQYKGYNGEGVNDGMMVLDLHTVEVSSVVYRIWRQAVSIITIPTEYQPFRRCCVFVVVVVMCLVVESVVVVVVLLQTVCRKQQRQISVHPPIHPKDINTNNSVEIPARLPMREDTNMYVR